MSAYKFGVIDYERINTIVPKNSIVLVGGTSDKNIPVSELGRAFEMKEDLLNRSMPGLKVSEAADYYRENVQTIEPEAVILHIGREDLDVFEKDPSLFDADYMAVIAQIRMSNPKCRIGIVSIGNPGNNPSVSKMNSHIMAIADSERCEFFDIEKVSLWNPASMKSAFAFANAMGLGRFNAKKPLRDIAKIIYGCQGEPEYAAEKATGNLGVTLGRPALGNA